MTRRFISLLLTAMFLSLTRAMDGSPTETATNTVSESDKALETTPVETLEMSDEQIDEFVRKLSLSPMVNDMIDTRIASEMDDQSERDGRDTVLARIQSTPALEKDWPQWSEEFDWQKQTPMPPSPGIEYLLRGYSPQHVEFRQLPFEFGLYGGTPTYDGHVVPKGMSFAIDDKIYTEIFMFQNSLEARDKLCGDMVSVYPSACAEMNIVKTADEARARGNIVVYVRTTAITHTLVAPALHSTRKSESPLIKKYGCQIVRIPEGKRLTCEIGRYLKALEQFGVMDEKMDEYSQEMNTFFEDKKDRRKRTDLISFFEKFEETQDLFNEEVGVDYEECCKGKKCKVLPFRHKLCTYIEYLPQGILDPEMEGNSVVPKAQFIEEVLSLPNCDILEDQVKDDEDFRGSSGLFISPPQFQGGGDSEVAQCGEQDMKKFIDFFDKYGQTYVQAASIGGEMRTTLEFSREELLTHAGTLKNNALDATRKFLAEHAIVDEPTSVIMTRYTNDNRHVEGMRSNNDAHMVSVHSGTDSSGKDESLTVKTNTDTGSPNDLPTTKPSVNDHDGDSTNQFRPPKMSGPDELRFEKLNLGRNVLPTPLSVSHETVGGTDLPVGMVQHGSPTRQEIQQWIKSLRHEGVPVSKTVNNIADVLAHPQIIRAMMLKCHKSPQVKEGDVAAIKAAKAELDKWRAVWFIDIMEAMKYVQVPSFQHLENIPCVNELIRLRTTLTNAAKFLEVKRTALIQENVLRNSYVYESSKLHNLKDRTFYNWLDFVELVHHNVLRSSGSTIGELWTNVKNYVHSTGSTAALTQPIMEYLKNSFQFEIICAESCAKMYNIAIRTSLLSGRSVKASAHVDEVGPEDASDELTDAMKMLGATVGAETAEGSTKSTAGSTDEQAPKAPIATNKETNVFLELERRVKKAKKRGKIIKQQKKKKEDIVGGKVKASDESSDLFVVRASLRQEAQLKVDECEASCRDSRDEILHRNIYTDTPSASTARDLFAALISWSQIMCEGIYRASMINGDTNAVQDGISGISGNADPNDAAKGHCRMMDNEAEIELCLSFLSTFLELMSKKAELDDWTQVSKHSFIFYAEKLMAFNPEFAYLNVNQDITNRFVKIPQDIIPDELAKNKILGQVDSVEIVKPTPEDLRSTLREMGENYDADILKSQLQSPEGRLARSEWQVMVVAQRFCTALLPNTNRNMGQRSKLDTYLDHNPKENPAARVETYLTHWRTTRHNILKVSEEISRTQDPDVVSQLKGKLDELGSDLFCDVFKYFNAKTALMRQASERNLMISQCYICHIMSEGLKKEDVCSAFEKAKYINFEAIGGDNSDAETITEKETEDDESGRGTAEGASKQPQQPTSSFRFRSKSKLPKATKMNMVDQFGFQPAETYMCNGRAVKPQDILKDTIERHVKAARGASMSKDVCSGLYDTYTDIIQRKSLLLAGIIGKRVSFDDCSKIEDSQKKASCVQNHFVKYNALASRLFTSSNTIKEEYRVIVTATKLFGEISKTPCMALGACSTDIMEKYIKLFMSNGRESPMKVVYPDTSKEENDKPPEQSEEEAEFKIKPPGLLEDTDLFGTDMSSFFSVRFGHLSNPLFALMKPAIAKAEADGAVKKALQESAAVGGKR